MKDVNVEFKDGSIVAGFDKDQDGINSISAKVNLNEAVQEVLSKGEEIKDAKVVSIKMELTKLMIVVDSDKDGENLIEITIDLGETYDELIAKK